MGPYGQKMVKPISRAGKNSGIFLRYISILALLLPTIYANLRKIESRKKKLRGFEFFLHGALWTKNG